jgi:hypothetical protein
MNTLVFSIISEASNAITSFIGRNIQHQVLHRQKKGTATTSILWQLKDQYLSVNMTLQNH